MKISILFLIYFIFSPAIAATFYKCVDPNGKISLQESPCSSSQISKEIQVYTTPKSNTSQGNSVPFITQNYSPDLEQTARSLGFNGVAGYQRARQECMLILSRYDLTAPSKNCSLNDMECFSRAGEATNRIFEQMTNSIGWKTNNCDTVMEIEKGSKNNGSSNSYAIEVSYNDELFIINGEKFKAKTYCFGMEEGDRVIFVEGSPFGACSSAKLINTRNERFCEVWCE